MKYDFNANSREIWREMRKGTVYEMPDPDTGPYKDEFYGTGMYEGIDFDKLIKYLRNYTHDQVFKWDDFKGPLTDKYKAWAPSRYNENQSFSYVGNQNEKKTILPFSAKLNKRIDYLEYDNSLYWAYKIEFDFNRGGIFAEFQFYYLDTKDKRIPVEKDPEDSFTVESKYQAVVLNFQNLDDFCFTVDYIAGERNRIRNKISEKIKAEKDPVKLNLLYKKIPEFAFPYLREKVSEEQIFNHLRILKSYDDTGWFSMFRDNSGSIINLLKTSGNADDLYAYFSTHPDLVKELYVNMDGESEINGIKDKNKAIFVNFLCALSIRQAYIGFQAPVKEFRIGKNYRLDSNVLAFNDKEKDKIFLQQKKKGVKSVTYYVPEPVSIEQEVLELEDGGRYYDAMEPVGLRDMDSGDSSYIVPAIFVKYISDEAEWKDIQKNIRIGADVLALVIGIATLGSSSPLWAVLGAVDVGLSSADLAVVAVEEELMNTEDGRKFLQAWNQVYLAGGLVTAAPVVIASAFNLGVRLLSLTQTAATRNFIKNCLIKILWERNIHNFTGNTVRILETDTEIVLATSGTFTRFQYSKLQDAGAVLISAEVKKGNKTVTEYALAYKGEIVLRGEKIPFSKSLKELKKVHYNAEKVESILENLLITSKVSLSGTGGFLKYSKIISRNVIGQEDSLSCAVACLRQLAKDKGILLTEDQVRKYGGMMKGYPTYERDMIKAAMKIFKQQEFSEGILFEINLSTIELSNILGANSPWVAWVKSTDNSIPHAIIIDKIENGIVYIRDPWPLEGIKGIKKGAKGVESIITINEFEKLWIGTSKYAFWFKK